MTIGRKLEIGVGAALTLVVAIGIAWLGRLGSLDTERRGAAEKTARRLQLASDMDSAGANMLAAMRGIVLFTAAGEPSQAALCKQEFESAAGRWRQSVAGLRPLLVQEGQNRLLDQMQDRLAAWHSAVAEAERAAARGDSDAALTIASGKGHSIYRTIARDTVRIREIQDGVPDTQRADAASLDSAGWWTDLGALGLAAAAGLLTLLFVRQTSQIAQGTWERTASHTEVAAQTLEAGSAIETAAQVLGTAPVKDFAAPAVGAAAPTEGAAPAAEVGGSAGRVDEIAFRMSLLSLSTALEAARPEHAATERPAASDEAVNLVRRSAPPASDSGSEAGSAG
jgi:hypothetical protein